MTVIIGSARGDEYGQASGGAAGDQKQKSVPDYRGEVSMQEWYLHSKGWVLLRPIDPEVGKKIAQDMIWACENKLIGYDQSQNRTLYEIAKKVGFNCSKVKTACETDCAQLVRVCVRYAGIECGDFYTATLPEALVKTGAFKKYTAAKYTKSDKALREGDILCTPVKGHVVVVCYTDGKPAADPDGLVAEFQKFLNENYGDLVQKATGDAALDVDDEYGPKTRAAALAVWKHMANKYYGAHLTVGNSNFYMESRLFSAAMTNAEISKHPTLAYILQGILAAGGYYSGPINGKMNDATKAAVKRFEKAEGLPADGEMDPDAWYHLFN